MYDVQQSDITLLRQRVKTVYTKIQLLNAKFMVIDEIQGVFLDGSISTDTGSDVRNTFDATILVKDKSYITAETARIWIDKHVRVFVGFLNQRTGEVVWYPKGVYNFNDNSFTYDATTRTLKVRVCLTPAIPSCGARSATCSRISWRLCSVTVKTLWRGVHPVS